MNIELIIRVLVDRYSDILFLERRLARERLERDTFRLIVQRRIGIVRSGDGR